MGLFSALLEILQAAAPTIKKKVLNGATKYGN